MQDKKYGEFNNFDDFFEDILKELGANPPVEKAGAGNSLPNDEPAETPAPTSGKSPERIEPPKDERSARVLPSEGRSAKRERTRERESRPPTPTLRNTRPECAERPDCEKSAASAPRRAAKPAKPEFVKPPVNDGSSVRRSIPFFAVLTVITVIAWLLPLRPTVSESEKRTLDSFPEYSFESLRTGEYFSGIESWFSDTFTFREDWIAASDAFERLYGIQTVAIHGDLPMVDAIPVPSPVSSLSAQPEDEKPAETDSPAETQAPAETEAPTEWGGMVVDEDALIADRGAKLQIGDSVFCYPGFSQSSAEKYAAIMNKAADILEGKANFYSIIAPNAVTSMLTREDREKYGFVIEEDAIDYMYSLMADNVKKVNVTRNLQAHNDEYIVFRTDPHWTALGAYYAYEVWCETAGKTPVPLSEYTEYAWENFYGTYYYASGMPKELANNPDTVYCYDPPGDVHLYLDFNNSDKLGEEYDVLLDRSTNQKDQYVTFLTSDQAKATLVNNSIEDNSACLVLKTSFGNPFVYYLTQHYHYVYVVDIRYYNARGIDSFADYFNVSDVIMIHATDLCYYDDGLATVSHLIR